jgi:hypothetical protein
MAAVERVPGEQLDGPAPAAPGAACPDCGEPWLRPTQLPGRLRCVYCLTRFELVSHCPDCGNHQTNVRMSSPEDMWCRTCTGSLLRPV